MNKLQTYSCLAASLLGFLLIAGCDQTIGPTESERTTTQDVMPLSKSYFADRIPPGLGLVSWWRANGNAKDRVDGNHGTLQGGATFGRGVLGQAFHLDGVDDFVMVPDSPNLNFGADDFTVALWTNFSSTDGEQVLIEKWVQKFDEPSAGWTLTKLGNNVLRLALCDGSGSEFDLDVAPASIPTNTWVHIAATRRGNTFTLYWNGIALGFLDCTYSLNNPSSLKIGHRGNPEDTPGSQDSRGFYLNGFIDEVMIFNRALNVLDV